MWVYAHAISRLRNGRQLFIRSCCAFRGISSKASVSNSDLTAKASWRYGAYSMLPSQREYLPVFEGGVGMVEGEVMQGGFRSSEQGSDQVVRTQEIHIVSSDSRHQDQKQERHQSQNNSPQFEPMTFSNTPFSVGEDGRRKGRRSQVVPAWRYFFVACLVMVDLAVMLISLSISLWVNDAAYNAINGAMPFWLFLVCFSFIWVLSLTFAGTYHRHVMAEGYELYAKIINASLLTIITYCSLAFIYFQSFLAANRAYRRSDHCILPRSHRPLADASVAASQPSEGCL